MPVRSYEEAGVSIDKGDKFASFIGSLKSKAVSRSIGGFAGGIAIDTKKYKNPIMLSTTDGVGTKLMIAQELGIYDTVGIDLVAMSVNDLIVCGAAPQTFLDYIACGKIHEEVLHQIIKGVVDGCEQAECTLAGGETAEMPDVYGSDDFDLAGFAVGIVDRDKMLPRKKNIKKGDIILGLPSAGIHSNGLSLARKVIDKKDKAGRRELLKPTKIYVKELKKLIAKDNIEAAAHITGGGLTGNLIRTLPKTVKPVFDTTAWEVPEIFKKIQKNGGIDPVEMERVFNMGIGIAMVVKKNNVDDVLSFAKRSKIAIRVIGEIVNG
ncbi:MAG: phosphoribosylformylglycinamidine cyclo-ligase [Spirochaetia bacterium]|nr:phosphoribosylformylglycinamidine cyclo-ligase [Spirochaetales bacterium]MBR5915880.1 phosphoribosylformylglycinamidine cyclo-ligase [Spirochaetia bacterium]MBR5928205.1 phosphoribosylformylglycinamidine cyclo-ligase [Spirochaetia bacterium]